MEGRTENNKVQIQCIPADGHISVQHSSPGGLELLSPNLCVLFDNGDAETRPAAPDVVCCEQVLGSRVWCGAP